MQLCPLLGVVLLIACSISRPAFAQAPVGTISGVVADETGAIIPNATIKIRNKATGAERELVSNAEGAFSAPALPAGVYEVRVELKGFRTVVREATVETGLTTTADMRLPIGQTSEVVNVEAATAQVEYEKHAIDGVVERQQIQDLPLNGRSFMQLASIEPGVSVGTGTTSQYNALSTVSILGGDSGKTAISVDGGAIRDTIEGSGSAMNFSQEVVQEFQVSSVNFDLSTDITSVGSVNVVTRTGSNQFHGSGYFYFRDHNMAAYPNLVRDPLASSPFFARRNPGFWVGGPIKKDKLFFFFNYEYMNQVQNYSVVPNLPSVAGLLGNFGSPYVGKTLSLRFDYRLNAKTSLFARYSHDGNSGFGPNGGATLPSNWLRNQNWSDQSILGVTTAASPTIVNDFRFSYQFWSNRNLFPTSSDCSGCLGLDGPQITFAGVSSNFEVGDTSNATQGRDLRKFTWQDSMTWQKGNHRMKFGGLFEYDPGTGFWGYCDPSCAEVFSPESLAAYGLGPFIPLFFPNLPTTIKTNADLLNLPFAGSVVGIGNPGQPPPYNINQAKVNDRTRFYFQDTWKLTSSFTLNYGVAWEYESNLFNEDLPKPSYLTPLYGSNLSATQNPGGHFSPIVGFAWKVGHDNKTVIRGGGGKYYDTQYLYQRLQERSEIGPVGNGRVEYPYTGYTNIFPGIINVGVTAATYLATGKLNPVLVPVGAALPVGITTLTLAQYEQIQAQETPAITASLSTPVTGETPIQVSKSGSDLYPLHSPVQDAYHLSLGVQRELRHDMVLSADFVRRVFLNLQYGAEDINRYNRYINGVQTPVIPICTGTQASNPAAECSTGPITFWESGARGTYTALLVKVDKRFAKRYQFTASYALQSQMGLNGIENLDNYDSTWGPQAPRQIFHVVGTVQLPWGFSVGLVSSTSSVGPVMPVVGGIDISGSGAGSTPLPGLSYNCLNISCGVGALDAAVANWNSTYAGKEDGTNQHTIPRLTLPANFSLGRPFNSQDIRLTKSFTYRERYKVSLFGEMFNVFNYANYSGYSYDPSNSTGFGIPTQRVTQVFGSGGPRAVQVGGRFTF
ncbi:MAG TPA: TonB-dependent receptor [Bryobacteraceae bacterium]|nr:TonB-dependent receptor [Bryobacteraceae bacterium]